MPAGTTTQGNLARVFVQKACGYPWVMLGCLGVTGIELDPTSLRYELCIDGAEQVKTRIINQLADPRPYTMTWDAADEMTRSRIMSLNKRVVNGCPFNLLLAQLECVNPNAVGDPYASASWMILYGNYKAASVNFGNNTYRTLDAKNANRFELQTQFAFDHYQYEVSPKFSLLSTVDGVGGGTNIDSIAFLDDGKCADGTCVKCGGLGCQIIMVHEDLGFQISLDGGTTWAVQGAAAAAGHVNAYDGKLFKIIPTSISVSLDGVTFTVATTDVAFAGLTNIIKIDVNYYVVLGSNGQVWQSTDGGGNWTQIRATDAAATDFLHGCYEPVSERLWSVGINAGGTQDVVEFSDDWGYTWTVATALGPLDSRAHIYCTTHATFIVMGLDLYKTTCDAAGSVTDVEEVTVVGATNAITGIGACDPKNCNFIYLTTADGWIFMSIDGGATWKQQAIPASIVISANATINPIGCCHSQDGDKPVFAFGVDIVQADALPSFF